MTEENDIEIVEESAPEASEPAGPLAGERLAEARREQQITVLEVAKELHLDEPKVRALEQNQFDVLGAPVFAKGHLRKYASLVGVDMDDVLQDYYRLTRASGMPPVVGKVRKPAREFSPGPWIAAIIILMLAAFAYWWFALRVTGPGLTFPQPASQPASQDPVETNAANDGGSLQAIAVSLPSTNELPDESVSQPSNEVELESQAVVEPEPVAVASSEIRLTLSFTGECWTEITDANGRRLFFDLGRDGRNVNVSGQAPLSVLFGNADSVSVQVNGSDYAISPADRRGETASFTISSP